MKEFKKILFPIDLSESSQKIVPYVITMAEKFDSQIHLLFVARVFDYFISVYVPDPSINTFEKELLEGAKRKLLEFQKENFQSFSETYAKVVSGYAPHEIITYINENKIDMVIMGTHGRKGLGKVFFGSVAERVVRTSPVPVFLVNPHMITLSDEKQL